VILPEAANIMKSLLKQKEIVKKVTGQYFKKVTILNLAYVLFLFGNVLNKHSKQTQAT